MRNILFRGKLLSTGEFAIRIIDDDKCYLTAPFHREREYLTIVGDIYDLNVKLEDQNGTT